ncbi:MAG TPA: hypothetical protein VMU87_02790 [Stellaceae bacterium]|nr:hypothetical protein [Stellaceae bacterium]
MVIVRVIGWLLFLAALVVLGGDFVAWQDTQSFAPITLDRLWSDLDPPSRAAFEATVARAAPSWAWTGIIRVVLDLWAAPSMAAAGVVLVWLSRHRGDRGVRRPRL